MSQINRAFGSEEWKQAAEEIIKNSMQLLLRDLREEGNRVEGELIGG